MTRDKSKYYASLDENNVVDNFVSVDYSSKLFEFSIDKSITNNHPEIGFKYDSKLKAFIPPKPTEYATILNTETYKWDPDPTVVSYHIEGIAHKWNPDTQQWDKVEE